MKAIVFSFLLIAADIYSQNQLVNESLASCSLPSNWSLNAVTGSYGFSIMKSSLMPQSDATCSIVYQQTNKTDNSPRKFSIATQDYSIFRYQSYRLTYGLRLIRTLIMACFNTRQDPVCTRTSKSKRNHLRND